MTNPGREFMKALKIRQRLEEEGIFPLSDEDKEIDKKHNIERKPYLGCLISILGAILFWSFMYILITSIQ